MPQDEAAETIQKVSEAIRKNGPKTGLMDAMSLLNEFLGRYSEAYDFAKQGKMPESVIQRLRKKCDVASLLRDKLYPDEALLVEPLRLRGGKRAWAVVVGKAYLQSDELYTAQYKGNNETYYFLTDHLHSPEVRSGYHLAIYSSREGTLHQIAQFNLTPESSPASETALYTKDMDGDGNEEAVVSCMYYGASWIPTTYAVAGIRNGKWTADETSTYEIPGIMRDLDKDSFIEIIGRQNIGDMGMFGHAGQPRYPVAYRWEKGKLINADAHIKPLFRKYLAGSAKAEQISKDDVEILGCKARALRVLGRNKEALAYYRRASKLNKAWAKRLWDGMTPFEARDRSR